MSNFLIRPAIEHDSYQLAELYTHSFMKMPIDSDQLKNVAQRFRTEIRNQILYYLVVEEKGNIIGMGGETRHIGSSFIGAIGVVTDRRKQGIGSTIIQRLLEQASVHNPTIELIANLQRVNLYRRFGFEEIYRVHVIELLSNNHFKSDVNISNSTIPKWLLDLDQKAMGFDRSRFLKFLIINQGAKLAYLDQKGYAMCIGSRIGPVIANDYFVSGSLVSPFLLSGPKMLIASDAYESAYNRYSPKMIQTALKMKIGDNLNTEISKVWGYHRFATS